MQTILNPSSLLFFMSVKKQGSKAPSKAGPKVVIRKAKKQFFEDLGREVTVTKPVSFYVADLDKPLSTKYGTIKADDLKKTGVVLSDTKKEFNVFDASFIDKYRRIRRAPQIIPLKDIGVILAFTGVGRDSVVVEGGSGSGALAILLSRYVKKVYSYEVNDEHLEVARENVRSLGIKNIVFAHRSLYAPIKQKAVDLMCLDLPEPWDALGTADKALKPGGFLVSYSPTVPQTQDFVNAVLKHDSFVHLKTVDIIEQEWQVEGRKVRPKSKQIVHSGFLTFCRKIR